MNRYAALLLLLISTHLTLAALHHSGRAHLPVTSNHLGYKNVIEQVQVLRGDRTINGSPYPGKMTFFLPGSEEGAVDIATYVSGIFYNQSPLTYWIERPIPFATSALLIWAFQLPLPVASLLPCLYLCLLLIGLYKLGKALDGPKTGLFAAIIAGAYPGLFAYGRLHHDVIAVSAFILWALYALARSKALTKAMPSAAGGLLLFLAMRSGESLYAGVLACLSLIGPLAIFALRLIRTGQWKVALANLGLFALPMLLFLDWRWLFESSTYMLGGFQDLPMAAKVGPWAGPLAPALRFGAYPIQFAGHLLGPLLTLLAGLALFQCLRDPGMRPWALGALIPLFALSIMVRKAAWYVVPILPTLALCTALYLRRSASLRLPIGLACITILLFHNLAPDSIRQPLYQQWQQIQSLAKMRTVDILAARDPEGLSMASNTSIVAAALPQNSAHSLGVIGSQRPLAHSFRYLVQLKNPQTTAINLLDRNFLETSPTPSMVKELDYIIYATGEGSPRHSTQSLQLQITHNGQGATAQAKLTLEKTIEEQLSAHCIEEYIHPVYLYNCSQKH